MPVEMKRKYASLTAIGCMAELEDVAWVVSTSFASYGLVIEATTYLLKYKR